MKDDYYWLAPFYESIARMVFGQELRRAHLDLMINGREILQQAKLVVWLGGGTGIGINELLAAAPNARLIYVDPSLRMLKQAQIKVQSDFYERVEWVNNTHDWLYQPIQSRRWADQKVDVLVTIFMLDVLPQKTLIELVKWANGNVSTWFYADFIPQKRWYKRLFIQFMYLCFMLSTRIRQQSLIDHQSLISAEGWRLLSQSRRLRAKQLVVSSIWRSSRLTELHQLNHS